MSMADSPGTDTHRMCTRMCLTFSVAPSIPYPLHPSCPLLLLPVPFRCLRIPAYARACRNGKWEFVVSLTFEYSSSSRSRPQRNPLFSSCFTHPFSFCILGCYLSFSYPLHLLYESHESLHVSYGFHFKSDLLSILFVLFGFNGWQLIRDRREW